MKPFERVFQIVKGIPLGKVMTYGEVAKKAGVTPKMVGWALHANKNPKEIPCHRVVMKDGSMAPGYVFGGPGEQKRKLTEEGVKFEGEKVKSETSEKDKIKNIILGDFSF